MEMIRHPETEIEYWVVIEDLAGYVWSTNYELSSGNIDDPDGLIDKSIAEARILQKRLEEELPSKFGVIMPKDCPKFKVGEVIPPAPENKIYYRDWHFRMKRQAYKEVYEKLICSACPFCEGLERMISLGGDIPCRAYFGLIINGLSVPFNCAMISANSWDEAELYSMVLEASGEEGLAKFVEKEKALKGIYIKESASRKS